MQQCDIFLSEQKRWSLSENEKGLMMETHQDIVDVAERVRSGRLDKQAVLEETLSQRASRLTTYGSPSGNHGQRDELISTVVDWQYGL